MSGSAIELPYVDLDVFRRDPTSEEADAECRKVAFGLHRFGILIVKDSRVTGEDNNRFLDMLEAYFEQPEEVLRADARPELSYQVGSTPSYTELPRDHCGRMKAFKDADAPLSLCPPELDPKWRFFWRLGDRPKETSYEELNAEPVVPAAFPQWGEVMNSWGSKMLDAILEVASMAALGFGLPVHTFREMMHHGPHLLAPTASNFSKHTAVGTVLAGFHYDLNLMTIHGKSRFPGLYIWTRDGQRVPVRVPDGCLFLQAGKQFEHLTAGHVLAGFHEVVISEDTAAAVERARAAGKPLWRISSTCFSHVNSDRILAPVGLFGEGLDEETAALFPPIAAGEHVRRELDLIRLGAVAPSPM